MGGLGSLLSSFVTSVATPAVGGLAGDFAGSLVGDGTENQLLKEITQTTTGALTGAALGAGLGALTGGKAGVLGGALTGGVGGGVGGYNAPEISKMFGMGAGTAGQTQGQIQGQTAPQQNANPPVSNADIAENDPVAQLLQGNQSQAQLNAVRNPIAGQNQGQSSLQQAPQISTAPTQTAQQPGGLGSYMGFLKNNFAPLALGTMGGSAITMNNLYNQAYNQQQQQLAQQNAAIQQNALNVARRAYGYADGGAVDMDISPDVHVHIPAHVQNQIESEGGIAALQPGMKMGLATGGYVNTAPFGQNDFYPQSRIPSAQPYAAAGNTGVVNTLSQGASFARGGLLEGPGDGMSDSLPANISGKEPVKVADGEYVIPKHIAEKIGKDKLHKMHQAVRKSAHAKHGEQVVQDAGKKAFIRTLSGIHA